MALSLDLIKKPEFVWATLDETLGKVRERLQRPEIKNKWQAFVLVYSDDDRYAAAPVHAIQPLVWDKGPAALNRTLKELGIFRLQAGIEQSQMEDQDAVRQARKHGGYAIVLQNGEYAGLVMTDVSYPSRPHGAFDFYDTALPLSTLTDTEFVAATADTTLAQVASDLKKLQNPQGAYVIVDMGDQSFRVAIAQDLNQGVRKGGRSIWSRPLRHFRRFLRPAIDRPFEAMGVQQAQELIGSGRFLVLTDNKGAPIGLVPTQELHRHVEELVTSQEPAPSGPTPDLFSAEPSFLEKHEREVRSTREPRFVNLWFEDDQERLFPRSKPLVQGELYHLTVNVGRLLEQSIVDWNRTASGPHAIVEPLKPALLYISVSSESFDIPNPTRDLWLPADGDTEWVRIPVRPLQYSRGEDLADLWVCVYYRTYLVQTFHVQAEVVSEGERAHTAHPQFAQLTHSRVSGFPEMEKLGPQELSLTITPDGSDRYRFTLLVDPDRSDKAAAQEAVQLSCTVRLTRDDLTHLITKARRQLHNVVQTFDLLQAQDVLTFRKATRALAQVGRQLYLKLFDDGSAETLREWMETNLADGSTLQIIDLAGDFVFPWSLVYTEQPWADDKTIDVTKFWGWRYNLVLLTAEMLDTYREVVPAVATNHPLRVSVGLYERLKGVEKQRAFFNSLNAQTNHRVNAEILTERRTMIQALQEANRDIYYFFCHGYTERVATDIQIDTELVQHFSHLAASNPTTRPQSIRDHLDDLFDVSDSWLRLTHGRLPLTMLKELVPDRLTNHPLVFLNMCESAQVLPSISDGFVPFFIKRGARAVMGTECAMNTLFADEFARSFLTFFLAGRPAGEALMALRRHYLEQGNPLALAYTLYCDADLKLSRPLLSLRPETSLATPPATPAATRPSQDQERLQAVESLWQNDMDGLLLTLAARVKAAQHGLAHDELGMWAPPENVFAWDTRAGPEWTANMKALGQKWWDKLEPQLYRLLCHPSEERDQLMEALSEGIKILAVALAPTLVANAAEVPAVAIVLATIAAKKIADAGLDAACELWSGSLPTATATSTSGAAGSG